MRHSSLLMNNAASDGCYQRLEFLGDAVIDYVVTLRLFEQDKCFSPGEITVRRAALVNNDSLAAMAVQA